MNIIANYYYQILIFMIFLSIIVGIKLFKEKNIYRIKKGHQILKKIRTFTEPNKETKIINYLRQIDPFTFEEMLLSLFKNSGCKITRNKRYTGDGGIDGRFKYDREHYFIQAKRYSNYIKVTDVQSFADVCKKNKVKGLFIHTGKSGKTVNTILSNNSHIVIIHPEELVDFIVTGTIKISN